MRVVHFTPNFHPEFRGGLEHYVEQLCGALFEQGVSSIVVSGSEARTESGTVDEQYLGELLTIRLHRRLSENYTVDLHLPRLEAEIEAILRRLKPDMAHMHHWFNLGTGIAWLCRSLGIPVVISLHDVWVSCPRFFRVVDGRFCTRDYGLSTCGPCILSDYEYDKRVLQSELLVRDLVIRRELASAYRVLVPSDALAQFLAEAVPGIPLVDVVPHGLLSPLPRIHYVQPGRSEPFRVGIWGSVVPEKGVGVLLDAIKYVRRSRAVELHVWGQCPDEGYIRTLRAQDELGVLHLHGAYERSALSSIASQIHLAVFPSVCLESYGLALDEALALGVPVIVSDRGALRERVGAGGVIVPAGEAGALANAISDLAGNSDQLVQMAKECPVPGGIVDAAVDVGEIYLEAVRQDQPAIDVQFVHRHSLHGRENPQLRIHDSQAWSELISVLRTEAGNQ